MKKLIWGLALMIAMLTLAACSTVTSPIAGPDVQSAPVEAPLRQVSVALDWFPWSNHAGLYVAQEKGYFAEQGLDVEIRTPSDHLGIGPNDRNVDPGGVQHGHLSHCRAGCSVRAS